LPHHDGRLASSGPNRVQSLACPLLRGKPQLSDVAWQWAGFLLIGGFLYFWWTRFLIELAAIHRRALKRGQLVTHPAAGTSVWLLFVTVRVFGFVATGLAAAVAPFVWQELLRFVGISRTVS